MRERCEQADAGAAIRSLESDRVRARATVLARSTEELTPAEVLVHRLLGEREAHADRQTAPPRPQLFPGRLPPDLVPLDLPLPPRARLVGSAAGAVGYFCAMAPVEVVLDVPGGAGSVIDFYARELPPRGWQLATRAASTGGFRPAWERDSAVFCPPHSTLRLAATAWTRPNGTSDVRLRVDAEIGLRQAAPWPAPPVTTSLCGPGLPTPTATPAPTPVQRPAPPLPALVGPPGALRAVGAVGADLSVPWHGPGPLAWAWHVETQVALPASALLSHLIPQIEAHGWRLRQSGYRAPLAWSDWDASPDGQWRGLVAVVQTASGASGTVYAHVTAVSPPIDRRAILIPRPDTAAAGSAAGRPPPDSEAAYLELAERLLTDPEPDQDGWPRRVSLYPERFPPDLPVSLPLPPGGRLLGSSAREDAYPSAGRASTTLVHAASTPMALIEFYAQHLEGLGWLPVSDKNLIPGRSLCRPDHAFKYFVTARALPDGLTEAWLLLDPRLPNNNRPCLFGEDGGFVPSFAADAPKLRPASGGDAVDALLAPVDLRGPDGPFAPADVRQRWSTTADAVTTLPALALHDHFAPQLRAAGWSLLAWGWAGPLAWSSWRVPAGPGRPAGEDLEAFFLVAESPGQPHRRLWLRVADAARLTPAPAAPGAGP